jgi:hypothetical protein
MIIDPHDKDGRWVMTAIAKEMARLKSICDDPNAHEDDVSDASNDKGLYGPILWENDVCRHFAGEGVGIGLYR